MKQFAAYLRVSTRDQDVAMQRQTIQRWAAGHQVTIPDEHWYEDTITGAEMQRAGLAKLEQAIFNGEVGTVVFYALDRFARDLWAGGLAIDRWQKSGVRMVFVVDALDVDPSNWMGDAMLKIIVAIRLGFAEMERERTRVRREDGIRKAKSDQQRAQELHKAGKSVQEICRLIGRDKRPDIVEKMIRARGRLWYVHDGTGEIRVRKARPDRIMAMLRQGLTRTEICNALDISLGTYSRRLRKMGGIRAVWAQIDDEMASEGKPSATA